MNPTHKTSSKLETIPEYYSDSLSSSDEIYEEYTLSKDPEKAFQLYFPIIQNSLLTSGSISRGEIIRKYEITIEVADRIMDCLKDKFLNTRIYED
jgi:hypothetical protein